MGVFVGGGGCGKLDGGGAVVRGGRIIAGGAGGSVGGTFTKGGVD